MSATSKTSPANNSVRSTVTASLASRVWQFLAGPITVLLIAQYFTAEEQGFFYAFSGYLGMQTFFELGLSSILVSVLGHEFASTHSENETKAVEARAKLADIVAKSTLVYGVTAVLFFLLILTSGIQFFHRQAPQIQWLGPWIGLVVIASLSFWLTPLLATLEATGHAVTVYRMRFAQAVLGSMFVWLALVFRLGLWTAVISAAVQLIAQSTLILLVRRRHLVEIISKRLTEVSCSWLQNVLPLQWRIALQGIALYLATQALTLVLMETQTAATAGQWGMTWSILLALQSMAIAWLTAAFPHATQLAAGDSYGALRSYWRRMQWGSATLLFVAILGFGATLLGLEYFQYGLPKRFIAPTDIWIFGIGMLSYHFSACMGYFVRAQKRESLYGAATIGQICVAAGCWTACITGGVHALCIAYALINLLIVLPLHAVALHFDSRRHSRLSSQ